MAEFKLGRIKFVWQGAWTTGISYVVDDVISNGGQSYVCVSNHTASSLFTTDLTNNPTYWNLVSGGTFWTGNWATDTYYNIGDQVKYGGTVYVAVEPHTSSATTLLGLEADQAKWNAFAQSLEWQQAWTVGTRYRVNDFVSYGGITYVCNTAHVSSATVAAGLEFDSAKWDEFNQGIVYLSGWTSAVRYRVNDVVKYGASTWICTTAHTSDVGFDDTKWDIFVEGIQFESTWVISTVYQVGDTVIYGGNSYIAKQNHSGENPVTATTYWDIYVTGFNFRSDWVIGTLYKVGDVVRVGGYTYLAIDDSTGQLPPNLAYWEQLNSGTTFRDVAETYTAVTGTTLGAGINATFDVIRAKTLYTVAVNNVGTGYAVADTITILGTSLGGLTPANDLVLTVTAQTSTAIDTISVTGFSTSWTTGTPYNAGDLVFLGASTFICTSAHTAAGGNRPDADTVAAYWNLFSAGAEVSILTTEGDTYYFGAQGPTRLPIGTDGQLLRVNGGYPTWAYYGIINNLVYVAPTGTDSIDSGTGISTDKPWRTVRFAADQIRFGYQNRQSKELIDKNRLFMMREISNWLTYTYRVTITASSAATNEFTSSDTVNLSANMPIEFTGVLGGVVSGTKYYVKTVVDGTHFTISATQGGIAKTLTTTSGTMTGTISCDIDTYEQNTGSIIDAVAFDISHGGNGKSVTAAKSYYTPSGNAYSTSTIGEKIAQTVPAYTYLSVLMGNVLANTAPTSNYQTLNSVATPATQIIDATLTAETGTVLEKDALISIVIDGISSGNLSSIPPAMYANTTISVKTGSYNEILPIVIPNYTAVVGDELRGTVIAPNRAISDLATDSTKTISSLNRIKSIVSDLVQNNSVTPTTGNTQTQVTSLAAGSVGSVVANERIESAVQALYDVLNNGITGAPTERLTVPTGGTANGSDSDYTNAIAQIAQNYAFIKADVTQYITNTYPTLSYDSAKCQRDVGYVLDALRYDLMYGGNTQSLIAGSSYYTYINYVQPAGEKIATIAAYTHLQSIIDNIAQNAAYTPAAGNTTPRVSTGTGDTTGNAALFSQARIQDVIDWVTNGVAPTAIVPDITWASAALQAGFAKLQSRKTEIQSDGLVWVEKFYQDLSFNRTTCSRDIGIMVDAIGYDMVFNSNFASTLAGNSYYRNLTSAGTVLSTQKGASLGLVNFLRYKVKSVALGGGAELIKATIDSIVNTISGGKVPPGTLWPSYVGIDAENFAGAKLVHENKSFVTAEVIQYITTNYAAVVYNQADLSRDVGLIVDAIRYDLTYGGNVTSRQAAIAYYSQLTGALQIDPNDKVAILAAYAQMKLAVVAIATGGAYTVLNGTVTRIIGVSGDATTGTAVGTLVQDTIDYIDDKDTNPITEVTPSTSWVSADLVAQHNLLQTNKTIIQGQVTAFLTANYPNLSYDSATCERDVGYMIDSIGYDLMFGSNFRSIRTGISYYQNQASLVLTGQLRPTLQAVRYLEELIIGILVTGKVGVSSARTNMDLIIAIIEFGSGTTPEVTGSMLFMNDVGIINASEILRANRTFLEYEATSWIKSQFGSIVVSASSTTFTTSTIHNLSVNDPVEFASVSIEQYITEVASSGNLITLRSTTGMQPNMKFTMGATSIGNLGTAQIYYILTVDNSTQITVSATPGGSVLDPGTASSPIALVTVGGVYGNVEDGIKYYVSTAPTDTTFTIKLTKTSTTDVILVAQAVGYMTTSYSFDEASSRRDMRAYIDALVHDLQFSGNHYSTHSAVLYNNARMGSQMSDMFLVSNSSGLRNCTLRGLDGDLTAENQYGTKRPTAGAFVALNPGFGPNDSNVWVIARSHYSQNVSMFGSGCSGAKIDSSVHAGGNKSMVKNDFTTIISDGIGVWCTGANALTELVSVFNYYGYAGYIAEKGARIRATNGNSSYGTYGVIAEGVSSKEIPIYGFINNRAAQAQITETITDSVSNILRMEFGNAGTGYTNVNYTINGSGYNAAAIGDEFRDAAIFETRIIDLNDDNGVGGSSYETASNSAQSGNTTQITIAATDQALSAAYVGMRIQITAGTGKGQFANIATYGTGSKIATVTKPSTGAAGWDHVVPGTPIEANLDLTTAYIIEPQITYTSPGYTATARTMATSVDWQAVVYGDRKFVAIEGSGTVANYSNDGKTWAATGALGANASWRSVAFGGGFGSTATAVVGGLGGAGAILTAVLGVPNTTGAATGDQIASVTVVNGGQGYTTPPVIVFTPTNGGTGAVATCAVLDGRISSVTITIPGTGYNALPTVTAATDRITHIVVNTWGRNYYTTPTVTITGGGYSVQSTAIATLTNTGVSAITVDVAGAGYTSTPTVNIVDTAARYVAIATGTGANCYITNAEIDATAAWTAGTDTGKTDLQSVTYGGGVYVAVGSASAISSTTGSLWLNRTIPALSNGTYSDVTYGAEQFIAIATGTNETAKSGNGVSWTTAANMPSSAAWGSIAYGNGRYVAIETGTTSTKAAVSYDRGTTWVATVLPSTIWSNIGYGQGLFFAIATGTTICATSPDGIYWTQRAMPSSTSWKAIAFGNPSSSPIWSVISGATGTIAATVKTGATALGRAKVADNTITEVRMIEPGSGYPTGTVSNTALTTDLITVNNTINLVNLQPVEFFGTSAGGLIEEQTYYVIGSTITSTTFKVASTIANVGTGTTVTLTTTTPSGMTYRAGPIITVIDPNNVNDAGLRVRLGDGALGNPSFTDRGTDNTTATTDVIGDGYSDLYQVSTFVNVFGLPSAPKPGSNVEFSSIPGAYYKLVVVTNLVEDLDNPGTYTATFQLNPGMTTLLAPRHGDRITTRIGYSQVRLTGHDYLYIGTGNFERTNYPNVDITTASQSSQELFSGGGRVFFTSTDQDGNFNVGDLFGVQQATGTATLNASAFNLSGLNSLQLGSVELGIGSAIITQFSTDPFFTADSDNVVPTQRAIRAYITAQIGGGQSSLNVNTLTSGIIYIAGNSISTTTGAGINVTSRMNFTGGIDGAPVALGYFLTR
jgi:hypothetical protein